jgi:hypothetical protein
MPDFRIVEDVEPVTYQAATETLSAELREALLRAFSRARLPEDDPLYSILVAQAELLNAGFLAQSKALQTTLEVFVSARQVENKQLAGLLTACQTSLKESTAAVAKQAALSAEQIESLKKEIRQSQQAERKARGEETAQFNRQLEELHRDLPDVYKAAAMLNDVKERLFWWTVGLSIASGAGLVILVQHLLGR